MKGWSAQVPALSGLLDRRLDLGTVELVEAAMRTAGFGKGWWSIWGNTLRSLKPHGSAPESVLDLLCFLDESSNKKMQQTDLDDVTVEHLTAGRTALREVIGKVELSVNRKRTWNCRQVAPWLWCVNTSWYLVSKALPMLRAMDARARILMTRLEEEAEKENHTTCLQEVALNSFGILFCRSPNDKDLDPSLE